MHRADILEWVLASDLHDVDLSAMRPPNGADRGAQHPERRPDALALGRLDSGFDPGVDAEISTILRFEASRGELAPAQALPASFDYQHSILYARVLRAIGVILQLIVAEPAVAQIVGPISPVDCCPVELVRPE